MGELVIRKAFPEGIELLDLFLCLFLLLFPQIEHVYVLMHSLKKFIVCVCVSDAFRKSVNSF